MMEFVLCILIRVDDGIQTAQCIDVAPFLSNIESFLENQVCERGKSSRKGSETVYVLSNSKGVPGAWRARRVTNPRHERPLHYVRPFVNLSHYLVNPQLHPSITTMVSVVSVLCQSGHIGKKRWRLADEETHVR
jgi:hypothetical protein